MGSNPTYSAMSITHEQAMKVAPQKAQFASISSDVPVGAVVVHNGQIIAARHNGRDAMGDPSAHAEMLACVTQPAHLAVGD